MMNEFDKILEEMLNEERVVSFLDSWSGKEKESEEVLEIKQPFTIEQLFDQYYDYISLHKSFGDKKYLDVANEVMGQLKLVAGEVN